MRTATLLVILASAEGILALCDDACASAITAVGEIPVAIMSRSSDCADFIKSTVTPNATTAYFSSKPNMWGWGGYEAPEPTGPPIPTYASACAAGSEYSSACSCASISPATETLPAPTVYVYDRLPNCANPAKCAEGYDNAKCGGGCGICVPDSEGGGLCLSGGSCNAPCEKSSDCASGICLLDSCCGSTCYEPGIDGVCTEWGSPAKLFKKSNGGGLGSFFGKMMGRSENRPGAPILGTWVPELAPQPTD